MKIIKNSKQADVWKHWFLTEQAEKYKQLTGCEQKREIESHRSDIKSALPRDIVWHEAKIEKSDISHIYIISSDDWGDISRQSFLVSIVGKNLNTEFSNKDSIRLSSDIKKKILFIKNSGYFDTKFILVSDKPSGPFTILEGNRRSVALLSLNKLLGNRIYLGISEEIKNYGWSRHAYKNKY